MCKKIGGRRDGVVFEKMGETPRHAVVTKRAEHGKPVLIERRYRGQLGTATITQRALTPMCTDDAK
jgi:hypothetical protein